MKKQLFLIVGLSVLLMGAPMISGCSNQSETTTTTRQTSASTDPEAAPTTTTTTTTTTSDDEPDSVLGATFHAIGTIVLFPFRLIGDAIELIV
jgi:uncharacterized lipoprotein YajG